MNKKNLLIISSLDNSLIHFRGDLIKELLTLNYKVFCAAPKIYPKAEKELHALGAIPLCYPLQPTGLNPFADLKSLLEIRKLIKKHNINLVLPYTIKPVIYGAIAARFTNASTIPLITGLGLTFSNSSKKASRLQQITERLYRFALKKSKWIIFQNSDDLDLFRQRKIIGPTQKTLIVNGSGVNLKRYPFRPKMYNGRVSFIIVARLIKEKGIGLFAKSAKELRKLYPTSEFHIIGGEDNAPSAIDIEELKTLHKDGIIIFHDFQKDVRKFLTESDVFVLPSFYREGVPRSILEALSIGMPIITTNTPGCRETVVNNLNGILISPNNQTELTHAMRFFLENPEAIENMGISSRKMAEEKFNVALVNKDILKILTQINH